MGRVLVIATLFGALVSTASGAQTRSSWAETQIDLITARGIFPGVPSAFEPSAHLDAGTLATMVAGLTGRTLVPPRNPASPVSLARLDAAMVRALGLRAAARAFARGARAAGLKPSASFGTEVVARLLGMRTDLPTSEESLELQPRQTATRADAAFSAARVLTLGLEGTSTATIGGLSPVAAANLGSGVTYVKSLARGFSLPVLTPWQAQVIQTGISFVGYPYVWGGEDEKTERGFDCSGLAWRMYRLATYPGEGRLGSTLQGRTAAAMAGEVPASERIAFADIRPADLLFFGKGPDSVPADIGHMAIYVGNGWMVGSSSQGVALSRLDWYTKRFAWGRRPLAEVGLES